MSKRETGYYNRSARRSGGDRKTIMGGGIGNGGLMVWTAAQQVKNVAVEFDLSTHDAIQALRETGALDCDDDTALQIENLLRELK